MFGFASSWPGQLIEYRECRTRDDAVFAARELLDRNPAWSSVEVWVDDGVSESFFVQREGV